MNSEFPEPSEELKRVAEEISSLRRDLQATSASLARIEKRLKAAFPNYPTKKKTPKHEKVAPASDKTSEELNGIFDSIVAATQEGGDSGFERSVSEIDEAILLAVAIEVGAGSASSLTIPKAKKGIRKRVQESMQLRFQNKKGTEQDSGGNP